MRLCADLLALAGAHERDAGLDKVAHDLIDVAADIADLGELGGLDLEERRVSKLGEPSGDLGLADAGRADHEDILRQNLFAHLLVELLPAPAVAQRDGHGAFCVRLAYDEAVQLRDDFPRGEVCHAVIPLSEILLNASRSAPSPQPLPQKGRRDDGVSSPLSAVGGRLCGLRNVEQEISLCQSRQPVQTADGRLSMMMLLFV